MKYVQKSATPQFFLDDTMGLAKWSDYKAEKKRFLKKHISSNEQKYLCIYCESKISEGFSHLEHIKPKHIDVIRLTFDYNNIVVSCNGTCHNNHTDNTKYHCGHRKDRTDTLFDESKFLNPVQVCNIREYFIYDYDDYSINPSDKDSEKAQYTIDTLHLNDGGLPKAREKALENFINKMKIISDIKMRKEKMKQVLNNENIAFLSFLRFKYQKVILDI